MQKRISDFQLFIVVCLASLILVLLGLRGYFSQSQLDAQLGKNIEGQVFVATSGRVKFDGVSQSMRVYANEEQSSRIIFKPLSLMTDWFDHVEVTFSDKASLQVLNLSLGSKKSFHDKLFWSEQPILYTDDKLIARLPITSFENIKDHIVSLKLFTHRLIIPYGLKSVRFVPKTFSNTDFLSLLWKDLVLHKQAVLISPKLLLVIYFSLVSALFIGLLLWLKRPISKVWWWVLLAAWLLLDMRYIYQQSHQLWTQQVLTNTDKVTSLMIKKEKI